ncbi:MAG: MFS transporter [Dysgonamonadaceae bacterium]|jgi:PAT family beta-lactamase induction signal transducer AmpG|nr:MFS transporter [Dysgonamonadaceae bacterium]
MKQSKITPWRWIPSLYFAEGLPYFAVVTLSVTLYKNMGLSNTHIALYTSWLYLPWVVKPFWSPLVDLLKTKRWWICCMELLIGGGLAGVAFCIPTHAYLQTTLAGFWLIAFSSATHDIAADGFYLLALNRGDQSFYAGIRSTFYRIASITGQGLLIYLAGRLERSTGSIPYAWSITFLVTAGLFLAFFFYHRFGLPRPEADKPGAGGSVRRISGEFGRTFRSFFTKAHAASAIFFMLTYRFSEAQLLKMIQPFLLDPRERGGLGLATEEVGLIYGVVGVAGLTAGGILGGILGARGGLKKWLWPMMMSMLLTSFTFVYLACFLPENRYIVHLCVLLEQFGYGFGFTAYILFLMYYSEGEHSTAHYAICTGLMALGMMLPGMAAGWIQELLGYRNFFIYVMVCSVVPVFSACLIRVPDAPQNLGRVE